MLLGRKTPYKQTIQSELNIWAGLEIDQQGQDFQNYLYYWLVYHGSTAGIIPFFSPNISIGYSFMMPSKYLLSKFEIMRVGFHDASRIAPGGSRI